MKKLILIPLALILFAAPMADDLLVEGFEGGTVPPTGWDVWQEGDAGYQWDIYPSGHTGSYSAYIWYYYANMDQWLVSPTLDLSGYENLDFSVWHNTGDDSF
ncbi:MAG: hypothetical protein GY771_17075, partial [bacterium]|nr:hypothetical protein [bacterium]